MLFWAFMEVVTVGGLETEINFFYSVHYGRFGRWSLKRFLYSVKSLQFFEFMAVNGVGRSKRFHKETFFFCL